MNETPHSSPEPRPISELLAPSEHPVTGDLQDKERLANVTAADLRSEAQGAAEDLAAVQAEVESGRLTGAGADSAIAQAQELHLQVSSDQNIQQQSDS